MPNKKIGFIGQGWIGKNYANDFEARGFDVVRYGLEEPYCNNGDCIKDCDIVLIAVPTPTTIDGFDDSILREAIKKVGKGKTAVIKSTLLPGRTESIQEENPEIFVMHSPEFLREVTAAYDAAHPQRNIVGIPKDTDEFKQKAQEVLQVLPKAPFELVCSSKEAEMIKYIGNCFLYNKVLFMNLVYDLVASLGLDWDKVKDAVVADPRIGASHMTVFYEGGRGAAGHCFLKDYEAFLRLYSEKVGDELGVKFLETMREKNLDLLKKSGKNLDLVRGVYGAVIE